MDAFVIRRSTTTGNNSSKQTTPPTNGKPIPEKRKVSQIEIDEIIDDDNYSRQTLSTLSVSPTKASSTRSTTTSSSVPSHTNNSSAGKPGAPLAERMRPKV